MPNKQGVFGLVGNTTKGVPLKIGVQTNNVGICNSCASVDSELSLLLGDDQDEIGQNANVRNAYFQTGNRFTAAEYGMYLVTRLDAYTLDDVLQLIDRSGPNIPIN